MAKAGQPRPPARIVGQQAKALYDRAIEAYKSSQFESALGFASAAIANDRQYGAAWNLKGVLLNNLNRPREALGVLEESVRLLPNSAAPHVNMAKSLLALGQLERCIQVAVQGLKIDPTNIEAALFVARARDRMGEHAASLAVVDRVLAAAPRSVDAQVMKGRLLLALGRPEDSLRALEAAIEVATDDDGLKLERASVLMRLNRPEDALAVAAEMIARNPDHAAALRFFGDFHFFQRGDRHAANEFYRKSLASHFDMRTATNLCFSLINTRGPEEAACIEEAQVLAALCIDRNGFDPQTAKSFSSVFERTCDFAHLAKFDLKVCAEYWATNDVPGGLHSLLSHVRTRADRLDLLAQHRRWGEIIVKRTAMTPIPPPIPTRKPRIRIGLMSSDLRDHPVAYFALPIFEHFDRERFELYAYSFNPGEPDRVQQFLTQRATSFRTIIGGTDLSIAKQMAADELDIIFELGGSTHLNKPSVLARRVAPVQASWLGYPHSLGLPTIDYLLVDPFLKPSPDLMLERPFEMPASWISLSRLGFSDSAQIADDPPVVRNGYITFGTANNPMKYSQALLALWAKAMHAVPGSRFLFVRPEGAVEAFRKNILQEFEASGIEKSRIEFRPVRGAHLPHYAAMDISLDCAPHTGGTSTCESLWMGVPVVTRVGEAFFERISFSNLSNAGLGDLCAHSDTDFVSIATDLSKDIARLRDLRKNLRQNIRRSPLGNNIQWVRDWEDRIAALVR